MFTKRKMLLFMFYLPGIVLVIRLVFTAWTLYSNPLGLRFPYAQLIPLGVMCGSCFGHFKLYRDAVPVVSILVPTLLQGVLIAVFTKTVMIIPFLPVFIPDVLYLVVKSVKSSLFPFYLEGDDDEDLSELLSGEVTAG